MLVGIHYDNYRQLYPVHQRCEAILTHNGIDSIRLDLGDLDFWDKLKTLDLFMYGWYHLDSEKQKALAMIPIIEHQLKIPCFPNMSTCWHFDDKIRQYYLVHQANFPIVPTTIMYDRHLAKDWANQADYPLIFKLKNGAASSNVTLVETPHQAHRIIDRMFTQGYYPDSFWGKNTLRQKNFSFVRECRRLGRHLLRRYQGRDLTDFWQVQKNYVLFQPFLPDNDYDTRITIIGDRAFAFRRFSRDNDFRSSGSGKIDYDMDAIDLRCVEIAFQVTRHFGFQTMAYDFLYDADKKPYFCEISFGFLDTAVYRCPGHWDSRLNWHPGHLWPQYCQLQDLLPEHITQMPCYDDLIAIR